MASATSYKNLKGKKVGVCVSGGLDSKTVCKRLVEEGLEVLAFSADLGQPDESDINNVRDRMATCGVETVIVDLKEAMAEGCFDAVQAFGMQVSNFDAAMIFQGPNRCYKHHYLRL